MSLQDIEDQSMAVYTADIGMGMKTTVMMKVDAKAARIASHYEVFFKNQWVTPTHAVRAPTKWLYAKIKDGPAIRVPPNLWRYKETAK